MKKIKNPKISIILPFKNAQKTLKGCFESLIFQTYENIEILSINCGCTDNSLKIAQNYRERDERIRILDIEETTTGNAKNLGIAAATGEYISFINPQDRALLNLYESFLDIESKDIDLFIFNAEIKEDTENKIYKKRFFTTKLWNNHIDENTLHNLYDCKNPFFGVMSAVNKIYNIHYLKKHNIKFAKDLLFEDFLFHIDTLINAEKIYVTEAILYKFKETDKELIKKTDNINDIFEIIDKIEISLKKAGLSERFKYAFLEYKYMQADYIFNNIKFSQRSKFFSVMQDYMKKIDMNDFDSKICSQLAEYPKFNDMKNLDWTHYSLGKRF